MNVRQGKIYFLMGKKRGLEKYALLLQAYFVPREKMW